LYGLSAVGEEGSVKARFEPTAPEEAGPPAPPTREAPGIAETVVRGAPGTPPTAPPKAEAKAPAEGFLAARRRIAKVPSAVPKAPKAEPVPKAPPAELRKEEKRKMLPAVSAKPRPGVVDLKRAEKVKPAAAAPTLPKKEISFKLESIDSIKKLSDEHFRKISDDPNVAAERIKSEVARLTATSPMDRSRAKEAWQQSELYKLYIAMGEDGMRMGKPISEVVKSRKAMRRPYLSEEEFGAVVELSKMF
jgi:hypothetical protein